MLAERKLRTAVAGALVGGQQAFAQVGTHSFVVPTGVTSISAVCIGGGGGGAGNLAGYSAGGSTGGGGAALSYSNNIPVTPGETLTVVVGTGGNASIGAGTPTAGGDSSLSRGGTTLVLAKGGSAGVFNSTTPVNGGQASSGVGDVRYSGGNSPRGGGGAAGYSGNGGNGGITGDGGAGSGGGGGGGSLSSATSNFGSGGGGVNMYGEGPSGAGGSFRDASGLSEGGGGSFGFPSNIYGSGGGGASVSSGSGIGSLGYQGAVRIIWGAGRQFPINKTADIGIGYRDTESNRSSSTITVPSTTKVGDLILFCQTTLSTTTTRVDPAGYTLVTTNTTYPASSIYYKVAVAGDAGSTITGNAGALSSTKHVLVISTGNLYTTWTPVVGGVTNRGRLSSSSGSFVSQTITSGAGTGPLIVVAGANIMGISRDSYINYNADINFSPVPAEMRTQTEIVAIGSVNGNGPSTFGALVLNKGQEQNIILSSVSGSLYGYRAGFYIGGL